MGEAPSVAVVIPCRDEIGTLERCIAAVRSQQPAPTRVIVVDNGSVDGSRELAQRLADEVIDVPTGTVARLRNLGGRAAADVDILAFLDADCEPLGEWFRSALDVLDDCTMVSARPEASPDATWVERRWAALEARNVHADSQLWSSNLVVPRRFFESLGGFDERLGTYEDWDLSERVRRAGGCSVLLPDIRVIHHGFPATVRAMVRRERWHTSTPGWMHRMSPRSRALVAVAAGWVAVGAGACSISIRLRRPTAVTCWAAASLAGTLVLGSSQGSLRHAPHDGVLLATWALARASRLPRGLSRARSQHDRVEDGCPR